jgi:superfamily II DNA or RNA helicase
MEHGVGVLATPLTLVQDKIARAVLGGDALPSKLGTIVLRAHQRAAATRLTEIIRRTNGALLAEPVGVGKTYTALAVATALGGDVTILAPASLRSMWQQALDDCRLSAAIMTHEALSRGERATRAAEVMIIDEAHRFRVPTTRRYAMAAELCRKANVLLVSATPVQNRRDEVAGLLALFLGRRAFRLTDEELSAHIVRGLSDPLSELPRLVGPISVSTTPVDDCVDQLVQLPPPVPARGESLPAALLTMGLLHQWSSSRAALVAALKRRRARALAMLSAIDAGARPTRAELSAWTNASDSVQLAFPALVVADGEPDIYDLAELRRTLETHQCATSELLRSLALAPNPDDGRAAWLAGICEAHRDERIIAFCHYEETVNALWARLSRRPAVAALTAKGARVAGGAVTRDVVLKQFIPGASRHAAAAERIQLLLTTDLLSEGLNLQEASVVIHLDYPWNPARLDQRVGRVRRLGSRHEQVTVYAVAPPAPAERLLQLEKRLTAKLRVANRTIGVAGHILPAWKMASADERSLADSEGELRRRLATWLLHFDEASAGADQHIVAAVQSDHDGFVALVAGDSHSMLVTDLGGQLSTSPSRLLDALRALDNSEVSPDPRRADVACERIEAWLAHRRASASIDFAAAASSRARRLALNRVAHALSRAPRHRRVLLAPLAAAARAAATAALPEGAERVFDTLVAADLSDEAWLRSLAAFGELNARQTADANSISASITAIILLQRDQ